MQALGIAAPQTLPEVEEPRPVVRLRSPRAGWHRVLRLLVCAGPELAPGDGLAALLFPDLVEIETRYSYGCPLAEWGTSCYECPEWKGWQPQMGWANPIGWYEGPEKGVRL